MTSTFTTPTAAASAFFEALHEGRWADAAGLVDAEAAATLREQRLALLIAWVQHRDEIRRAREGGEGGGMFGFSSDGKVDQGQLAVHGTTLLPVFRGSPTLAELASMSTAAFVELLLEVSNSESGPGEEGPFERPRRRVLGEVREGESIAHVLYRQEGAGVRYTNPHHVEVVQLRRTDSAWRVLLGMMQNDLAEGGFMLHMDLLDSGSELGPDRVE